MFECKACKAKDQHIADLKDEVKTLRKAFLTNHRDLYTMEANALLGAENAVLNIPTDDAEKAANDENEAAQLLTGGY